MFTLANSIAVSMHTIGFCESVLDVLAQYLDGFGGFVAASPSERTNDVRLIGSVTLVALTCVALVGMGLVSRVQMGLLGLLVLSQVRQHIQRNNFQCTEMKFFIA